MNAPSQGRPTAVRSRAATWKPLDSLVSNWNGGLTLRALATHYLKNFEDNGIDPATDSVGENTGVYDNTFIECDDDCPVSTVDHRTINDNRIDGAFYLDANVSYELHPFGGDVDMEVFFNVRNLTNEDPALVAQGPGGIAFPTQPANPALYDTLGRVYRVGVRMKM